MSLSSPHMSLPYLTNLCSSPLHPAAIVDILSELEAGVQFDASAASAASPDHLKLVSTYYSVYLLSLLLDADLNEGRFLLQRIPVSLAADQELSNTATLLRALYTRNYPAIYAALDNPVWSSVVAPLRDRFRHDFRKSTFGLLSKAYNAISPASAAFYLGLDAASDTLVPDLESEGWIFDRESGLLKPVAKYENEVSKSGVEDLRIGRLTSLVTHLTEV